jgi:hypothetical protein
VMVNRADSLHVVGVVTDCDDLFRIALVLV